MDWKDIVNTEDVDTPERFDAYLRDRANEAKLEALKVYLECRLDEIGNSSGMLDGEVNTATFELLAVARLLGLNTTWWENAKSLTPSESQSFAEVTDASDDR